MADFLKFTNNATSILSVSIGAGDTLITVGSGDGALYPTLGASEFFYATLEDGSGNLEIVKVTARSGDNFTVERGADNTTAQAWAMNATRVELRLTAIVVEEFLQKNGGIMTGELDMDGNYITDGLLRAGAATTRYVSGSEIVDVPLRGTASGAGNEVTVPTNGTDRAQAGGVLSGGPDDILVAGDDLVAGGVIGSASETAEGVIEIADDTEMGAGTDDLKAVTPAKFAETNAEEADGTSPGHFGTTRFAQAAEITPDIPTVDNAAISPARLIDRTATEDRVGLIELADQAEVDAGTVDDKAVTPLTLTNFSGLVGAGGVVYSGYVDALAVAEVVPAGWSATRTGVGLYTVTHNLGLSSVDDLIITLTGIGNISGPGGMIFACVVTRSTNFFTLQVGNPDMGAGGGGGNVDRDFMFICSDIS